MANFGDLLSGLTFGASESLRRNAANNAFETFVVGSLASANSVNNSNWSGTALSIGNGGTGQTTANAGFGALSPNTTKGDITAFSTVNARFPVGTNGHFVVADSAQALGIKYSNTLQSAAVGNTPLVVKQFSDSQTAPFIEAQKADGTVMAKLQKAGYLTVGGATHSDSDFIALYVRSASNFPFRVHHTTNGQLLNLSSAGLLQIAGGLEFTGSPPTISNILEIRSTYYEDLNNTKGYFNTGVSGINFDLYNRVAGNIPMVIRAEAAQSANNFEIRGLSSRTFAVDKDANLGIGITTGLSGALHIVKTTNQARFAYDGSNYLDVGVGNTGVVTLNAVGSGAKFVFSDDIDVSAKNIITDTSTGTKIGTGSTQKLSLWGATPVTQRSHNTQLTDLTGGTGGTTLQDVDGGGGVADVGTINDNFARIITLLNKVVVDNEEIGQNAP